MQRFLITFGVIFLLMGVFWPALSKMGLGSLPGDFKIERENFQFYFPFTTSLLLSLLFNCILWFIEILGKIIK